MKRATAKELSEDLEEARRRINDLEAELAEQKQQIGETETTKRTLAQSEAFLTQSTKMANLGYAVWDDDLDRDIAVSEELAQIHGMSQAEYRETVTDMDEYLALVVPEDRERYLKFEDAFAADESGAAVGIEYRITRTDGKTRSLHQRAQYVAVATGKPTQSIVVIHDITDQIEREIELGAARNAAEKASEAKSSFLAMMSHEIRTPLNAVLGTLGLIQSHDLDPALQKLLNVGRKSSESLLSMINDILVFSKIEAGKLPLEPVQFEVRGLVENVVFALEQRAAESSTSLRSKIDLDVPEPLIGDAGRIRQILLNICNNAVRATNKGSVNITVSQQKIDGGTADIRFQIDDSGHGIAQKDQQYLFEEFWGADAKNLGDAGSTGLGLPICKQLVDMLGGAIGFESEPDRGSSFWFVLPLEVPSTEPLETAKNQTSVLEQVVPYSDLENLDGRVLLVEDNEANQLIAQTILEKMGLEVQVAANGKEAVDAVCNAPFDLVLMDINMPKMSGLEATKAMRKLQKPQSSLPIIAMTARAMPGDREKFLSEGMNGYISKPIYRDELHATISHFLTGSALPTQPAKTKGAYSLSSQNPQILDVRIFNEIGETVGPDRRSKIVATFLTEVPHQMEIIVAAAENGDCDLVAETAHQLIGTSSLLGAVGLAKLAGQLEFAGRGSDLAFINLAIRELPTLFESTQADLVNELGA